MWRVNAWGYGNSGYGASRTQRVLADSNFSSSARCVLEMLHDPDNPEAAVQAYYYLLNTGAGHVNGWGPAFFTKFLAFADPVNQPGSTHARRPALILDRWIAAAVNHYLAKSSSSRISIRSAALGNFRSAGWTTPQYAFYLSLVERLTGSDTFRGPPCNGRPMAVERALFCYFRHDDSRTPRTSAA